MTLFQEIDYDGPSEGGWVAVGHWDPNYIPQFRCWGQNLPEIWSSDCPHVTESTLGLCTRHKKWLFTPGD